MIFKDKSVVITGGSDGVGAAVARQFADAGANLTLAARGRKKLEAVAEELRDKTRVKICPMDVADAEACVSLLKKAEFEFGGVDILINNAGSHTRGLVEKTGEDDLATMVDVNLRAPIVLSRLALPYLRKSEGAAIVNVGSLAGRAPIPGSAVYGATKAGLRSFSYALAEELRDSTIKVALVSPGPIDTGFIMSDIDGVSDLTFSQPMSTAEQVAQTVLDLCGNSIREQSMPYSSGVLTTIAYLAPWLSRAIRPMLEKKGQRVKRELKAAREKAAEG